MTYEIYRYIFLGGAILAGIMFVVSAIVFFVLKIPTVIGDLTGANARKAIENIRNQNESTGEKTYRSSPVNRERGKLTDKITPSGRLIKNPSHSLHGAMGTEKISTQRLSHENGTSETTVLAAGSAGTNETTVLVAGSADTNETTVLAAGSAGTNETTVLAGGLADANGAAVPDDGIQANEIAAMNARTVCNEFIIEYEITYIHTDEVIA